MKKYKKWLISLLLVLVIFILAGNYLYEKKSDQKKEKLIYIPKTVDGTNDFWTSLILGTKMAAKEYGADLTILAPEREQDVKRQNELLQQAIEEKPDAILISPSSFTDSDELLKKAKKAGISIVYIDSYTKENLQEFTVATDNLEAGRKLGEYARRLIEDEKEAQIAIVSHVKGVSTAVEREQGFREGLGELGENVVEVVYCDSQFEKAYELTQELLKKYPHLKLIAGMNEYSSVGAARAIRDAGAVQKVKVVGIDSSKEAVQLMEEGVFSGLVIQKAFKMGYIGVREAIRMIYGEKVEKNIDSGSELVTLENMYSSEIEKLLFPFDTEKPSEE